LLKTQQKDFAEARKYLKKAVEFDAENYLAHFAYAYVLSRDGMTDFGFIAGYKAADAKKYARVCAAPFRSIRNLPNLISFTLISISFATKISTKVLR
jgi:tetratricopeptide (TPR) repeat protein